MTELKPTFRRFREGETASDWDLAEKIFQADASYKCPTYIHKTPPCQASCPSGHEIRGWLAIARHADAGLASYQQTLLFGYFYRPTAMLFWELREQLAGLSVTGQLWISLLLLASCGVLLSGWLRSTGLPSLAAALAGALLVLCPPIAGTAMWLSSHNEMLAVAFGLLALWASSQMSWWRWCLAALALFLSITSKVTGYVFALAAAVQQLP